jgi:hypothetical protein
LGKEKSTHPAVRDFSEKFAALSASIFFLTVDDGLEAFVKSLLRPLLD